VRELLSGGKPICYGAKAIPEGGFYSMPKNTGDGFIVIGDSASFLNAARLKGIHLAIKAGMLAAETVHAALQRNDTSAKALGNFKERFQNSWAYDELFRVRNWRAGYAHGLAWGGIHDFAQRLTGGRGFRDPLPMHADHKAFAAKNEAPPKWEIKPDGTLTYDKVTDVFFSGTTHAEDQPAHLKVPDSKLCVERCTAEFGNPCQHFCPAGVYEWIKDNGTGHLQINFGNCVHCKTCDIKDPYENINWTTPEGGGGPRYQRM
jgi:electron-transferring-flavoprotein dehydrogenase